jgi:hypothetical protein
MNTIIGPWDLRSHPVGFYWSPYEKSGDQRHMFLSLTTASVIFLSGVNSAINHLRLNHARHHPFIPLAD